MCPELIKKRIVSGLIGCAAVLTVAVAAYFHFSTGADAAEFNSGWRAGVIVVGGLSALLLVGLLGAYFFAYRWLGISRTHWRRGRAMTLLDGAAGHQPRGESWFFLSVNECLYLISVLAVVSVTAGFIHHLHTPSAFACVEHGTVQELKDVLGRYPEQLNGRNRRGATLLIQAIRSGRQDMVDFLLIRRPDVNTADRDGKSALMYAVGEPDLVERLLEAGASPNAVDNAGNTPLLLAVQERAERSCALLLCYGADPESADSAGDTPLHTAARYNHPAAARLLLQAGSDPARLSQQGWSPLHLAVLCGSTEVVEFFLKEGVDVNLVNARKQTPLNCAVHSNNAALVKLLLDHGADIGALDQRNNTVLHEALLDDHRELVDLLIQYGADPDARNSAGISPRLLLEEQYNDVVENTVTLVEMENG
ncbi:ankyrin repeat domain-containing protein [Verrucomicrobia bacterium S94]|nr:ankyrin repeat domain-containing protein [Verrucomicrobia bacterium S94]